jgi:hypothetical protein
MSDETHTPLEETLDMILAEESEPSHEALMRWCKRYPQYCDELAKFFATWAVEKEMPGEATIDEAHVGNLMVSHVLNLLHHQKSASAEDSKAVVITRLAAEIAAKNLSEEEFGRQCGLDESIIAKLDRRLIRVLSIPLLCMKRMAAALALSVEAVKAMLTGPPISLRAHKAHGRPSPKVEDFIDAVRASDLSEEEKQEWIRAIAEEK